MHVHKGSYECMHHSTNVEVRGLVGVKSTPLTMWVLGIKTHNDNSLTC